jgi:hypothetical protein
MELLEVVRVVLMLHLMMRAMCLQTIHWTAYNQRQQQQQMVTLLGCLYLLQTTVP